jgi:hypothetical protein
MLRSQPPLQKPFNSSDIFPNAVVASGSTQILRGTIPNTVLAMLKVKYCAFFLKKWVIFAFEDLNGTTAIVLQPFPQLAGLVFIDAIEEAIGELEPEKMVGSPNAGEQTEATHYGLLEDDSTVEFEVRSRSFAGQGGAELNPISIANSIFVFHITIHTDTKHPTLILYNGLCLPI